MRTRTTWAAAVAATAILVVLSAGCRQAAPGAEQASTDPVKGTAFEIRLDTDGALKMTAAPLKVTVREGGMPASDVDVSVELRMPPSGAMGEMRTGTELRPVGDGRFEGQVDMMMAGQWNAIVRVTRGGEVVATHTQAVTAE